MAPSRLGTTLFARSGLSWRIVVAVGTDLIQDPVFFLQGLFLRPTSLPTISPVADQELEAETVDSQTRLEADAEVGVIHFVFLHVGVQQAQVAGDGEEQVVIPRRKPRQLVLQELGDFLRSRTFPGNPRLGRFGEDLGREVAQPGFEHGADDVDIIQIMLVKEVDVPFCPAISHRS